MDGADEAPVGGEVHLDSFLERGGRDGLQRTERTEDAGIAEQAVETAETIEQGAGETVDTVHVAHIHRDQRGLAAGGGEDLVVELCQRLLRAGGGDDVVAGFREFKGCGAANAAGRAGDEDDALVCHGGGLAQLGGGGHGRGSGRRSGRGPAIQRRQSSSSESCCSFDAMS